MLCFVFFGPLPLRCFAGPGRMFSLYPVSPAPLGPHMSWVPAPSAHLPQDSALALNVLSESVRCPFSLAPSLCPSLYHFCPLPPRIPVAEPGPAPTEWPRSPGPRPLGYSEGQGRGWSGCPGSSGCPGRRLTTRWSCSWWAFRRCRETSPCWGRSSSAGRRSGRPGCGGSGPGCRRSSGQSQSPGLQEGAATHQAGSCNHLERKQDKDKHQICGQICHMILLLLSSGCLRQFSDKQICGNKNSSWLIHLSETNTMQQRGCCYGQLHPNKQFSKKG